MNILIIENYGTLAQLIEKTLSAYGYSVCINDESFESKGLIKKNIFDFVVMNTSLGGKEPFEILDYIRSNNHDLKILGVCNKGNWVEKVNFLNHGGDDVLSYPFPMQELIARIQALIRRPNSYVDANIYIGDFVLDTRSKCVFKDEKEIDLRRKEYELFEYLARNKERIVSRCELLDHVWDYREYVGSNTIDVHIKRLRDKLDTKGVISTIHGVGYQVHSKKKLKHHRHN